MPLQQFRYIDDDCSINSTYWWIHNLQVEIGYKQATRNYRLIPSHKHLCKRIVWGSKFTIARDCLKDPVIRRIIVRRMGVLLQNEIMRLCAKEVLQGNPGTLASFTWKKLMADMEKFAPTPRREQLMIKTRPMELLDYVLYYYANIAITEWVLCKRLYRLSCMLATAQKRYYRTEWTAYAYIN